MTDPAATYIPDANGTYPDEWYDIPLRKQVTYGFNGSENIEYVVNGSRVLRPRPTHNYTQNVGL